MSSMASTQPLSALAVLVATFIAAPMAAFAADPANVNPQSVAPPAATDPRVPSDVSPEVRAQMEQVLASLPPGPTGDAATACEVILCLAGSAGAGGGVSECVPPIRRYLSIKPPRLFTKRLNFLKLCPKTSGQGDARMDSLVEIMARAPGADGEGRICSSSAINAVNTVNLGEGVTYIRNDMPRDCELYYTHEYTDLRESVPVYIGEPMEGGFWAEQDDQSTAQARYDAELEQRRRNGDDRTGRGGQQRSAYSTL
jgi:TrbM